MITTIQPNVLQTAYTYPGYYAMVESLLAQGKTTGPNQDAALVDYARLNLQRMKRLNKTTVLLPETKAALDTLNEPQLWVVLTEGWCGDAAQIVPVIAKLAEYSTKIELKILLRDEHLSIMDSFLTNGGRAIPKLIALQPNSLQLLGSWGPRPAKAQDLVMEFKSNPNGKTKEEFTTALHGWYTQNKTKNTQQELAAKIAEWS